MTPEQRDRLRELAGRATPGPWHWPGRPWLSVYEHRPERTVEEGIAQVFDAPRNAAFIAACDPSTILAVLDALDQLRKEREALAIELEAEAQRNSEIAQMAVNQGSRESHATIAATYRNAAQRARSMEGKDG